MQDVRNLISRGLEGINDEQVLLAAPFHIPTVTLIEFLQRGRIAGVVIEPRDSRPITGLPVLGRWIGVDHSQFRLEKHVPRTMLFLGTRTDIGGRILVECARRGIRHIRYLDAAGGGFASLTPWRELKARSVPLLLGRLGRVRGLSGITRRALSIANVSFENGYRELVERSEFLRLPRSAFHERRVMIYTGSLGPGGAERQIAYCARGLARSGRWQTGVAAENLTPPYGNFYERAVREAGAEVYSVDMAVSEKFSDPQIAELWSYFKQNYAAIGLHDVIQNVVSHALYLRETRPALVHTWMDACNVRVGLAAAIVGVPHLIMSGRSVAPDHFAIFQPYMRDGYRAIMRSTPSIMLNNSRAGADDYARWLGIDPGKIKIIRNGFEFPDAVPSKAALNLLRSLGWSGRENVLGGLLRFTEEKRPDLWVETAEKFVAASPNNRAVAFGDGPMRETLLHRIQSCGLADVIKLPGITHDAWAALASFSVFLLTSRMEGLPNVLVEAQGVEIPVVSVAVGGAAETFRDGVTGVLVREESASALAAACVALAEDPLRRQEMGRAAGRFVREEFSSDRMVAEILDVYEQTTRKDHGKTGWL